MEPGTQGPARLLGEVMAGYRFDRVLGKGASGAVFLGQRLPGTPERVERTGLPPLVFPQQTAIKVLMLPWQLEDAERRSFRARFMREAEVLEQLSHPHILKVFAADEDPATGLPYMILPYLAGGTLADRLASASGPLPLADIATLLAQLADALDYAHMRNIIHRDVKPANILLDDAERVYLSDFSIARLLTETQWKLTTTGRVMGTPAYMAPEQFGSSTVTAAADIYSLGMVLYELVTGHLAFASESLPEIMRAQLQDPAPPPQAARADLPDPAAAAILRALEKDPSKRFPTAGALARAFSAGLEGRWTEGLEPPGALVAPDATGKSQNSDETLRSVPEMAPVNGHKSARAQVAGVGRGRRGQWWIAMVAALLLTAMVSGVIFAANTGRLQLGVGFAHAPQTTTATRALSDTASATLALTATMAATNTPKPPTPTRTPKPQQASCISQPVRITSEWAMGTDYCVCKSANPAPFPATIMKNISSQPISWTIDVYSAGFTVSPASGTLNPGASVEVNFYGPMSEEYSVGLHWPNDGGGIGEQGYSCQTVP